MQNREWSMFHWNARLNIELFQASWVKRGFPVHMHDHYVISFIETGLQSFSHRGSKYYTPPGGLIMLNPGDAHTGEPASHSGFEVRSIYPTVAHMQEAVSWLTGRHQDAPYFVDVRVDDQELANYVRNLYAFLLDSTEPLEMESHFISTLSAILVRAAEIKHPLVSIGRERKAVKEAREYINSYWPRKITLADISKHVGLSRYHLLRVFCNEVGLSPHAYLDSVRISQAKRLLRLGSSPSETAFETGFSDQSHFANRFKRLVGVTPGVYAQKLRC